MNRLLNSSNVNVRNQVLQHIKTSITENKVVDNIDINLYENNNINNSTDASENIIVDTIGFIMSRHVNNNLTSNYWKESYNCIRALYPVEKILIIDDNSDYQYIKQEDEDKLFNCEIIKSEYPRRGELLPYYYYYKNKIANKVLVIHDSVFIKEKIDFDNIKDVKFMWHFSNHILEDDNYNRFLINKLNNNSRLLQTYNSKKWLGCFGVMSCISHDFITNLQDKYNFSVLLDHITSRHDRMCLERVFAVMCFTESNVTSINGDILNCYIRFGINFNDYINHYKNGTKNIKVWTGR